MRSRKVKLFAAVFLYVAMMLVMVTAGNTQENNQTFNDELQAFKNKKPVQFNSCNGSLFCTEGMVDACRHARMRPSDSIRIPNFNEKPASAQETEKLMQEGDRVLKLSAECVSYATGFLNGISILGLVGKCSNPAKDAYDLAKEVVKKYDENPEQYKNLSAQSIFYDVWRDYCKK